MAATDTFPLPRDERLPAGRRPAQALRHHVQSGQTGSERHLAQIPAISVRISPTRSSGGLA